MRAQIEEAIAKALNATMPEEMAREQRKFAKAPERQLAWKLYGEGMSQREIAQRCDHQQAWVSKLLDEKRRSGLIATAAAAELKRHSEAARGRAGAAIAWLDADAKAEEKRRVATLRRSTARGQLADALTGEPGLLHAIAAHTDTLWTFVAMPCVCKALQAAMGSKMEWMPIVVDMVYANAAGAQVHAKQLAKREVYCLAHIFLRHCDYPHYNAMLELGPERFKHAATVMHDAADHMTVLLTLAREALHRTLHLGKQLHRQVDLMTTSSILQSNAEDAKEAHELTKTTNLLTGELFKAQSNVITSIDTLCTLIGSAGPSVLMKHTLPSGRYYSKRGRNRLVDALKALYTGMTEATEHRMDPDHWRYQVWLDESVIDSKRDEVESHSSGSNSESDDDWGLTS